MELLAGSANKLPPERQAYNAELDEFKPLDEIGDIEKPPRDRVAKPKKGEPEKVLKSAITLESTTSELVYAIVQRGSDGSLGLDLNAEGEHEVHALIAGSPAFQVNE